MRLHALTIALATAGLLFGTATAASAGERRFTYAYEPKVLPAGAMEFEPWWTSRIGKASGIWNRWDLRLEFEFGLTDTVLTAFYLNLEGFHADGARSSNDTPRVTGDGSEVKGFSNEWIWKLMDAAADPLGVALYAEWTWDGEEFELELKGLFGKELGPLSVVYNLVLEWEWEFEHEAAESKMEIEREAFIFENVLGASIPLAGAFRLGVELRQSSKFEHFTAPEWTTIAAGPNLHYAAESWWLTATVLAQLGAAQPTAHGKEFADNEQVEVRLVIGIHLTTSSPAAPTPAEALGQ